MINLQPPKAKESIKYARLNVVLVRYLVVAIVVVAGLIASMIVGNSSIAKQKQEFEATLVVEQEKVSELSSINDRAKTLAATIDTISVLIETEKSFSNLLKEIGGVIPSGAVLTNLSLSSTNNEPLKLTVSITDPNIAGVLQENIAKSDLFIGANIERVGEDAGDPEYSYSADLTAYFVGQETQAEEATNE